MYVDVVKKREDIALVEVAAQQVIGIRKTGTYTLIPELLIKIYEYSVKKKMVIDGPPLFLCHENSPKAVMEANERGTAIVEVAWPVSGTVKGSRGIKVYRLPGRKWYTLFIRDRTSHASQHTRNFLPGLKYKGSIYPVQSARYIQTIPG